MSVAGAMAGSCVSLMKHWEGCCLFQGSGGSLVCQDALPGWRVSCQKTPRPPLPRSSPRLLPSALPRVQRPAHSMSVSSPSTRAQHFQCHAVKLVLFQKCLVFPREGPPVPLVYWGPSPCHRQGASLPGCPFPFIACLGYSGYLIGVLNLLLYLSK